ncbi:acyltransferase family protein [Methylobacterium crusticola]|nr:acyltransferase family protein [Methylobacterium crusticola]
MNNHVSSGRVLGDAYRPDIDGLRCVAVIAVVGFHAFPLWLKGGFIGVDIFFVISGYLISAIIYDKLNTDSFSLSDFYARRIRRIFPSLIVVLAATAGIAWFCLRSDDHSQVGRHIAAGAAFLANIVLWNEAAYFDTTSILKPLLHLWSLAVEEQFYIVWPISLMLIWKYCRNYILSIAILIGLVSFAINILTLPRDPVAAFYLPFGRLWELMIGCALAYLVFTGSSVARGNSYTSCIGILLIIAALVSFDESAPYPGWRALLPTAGACLLIAAGPNAWFNRRILAHPVCVGIGLISYPLYLWHWPILSFGHILGTYEGSGELSRPLRISLVFASFVLSWLTYRFIEKPVRLRTFPILSPSVYAATATALMVYGLFITSLDGLPWRSIDQRPENAFLQHYSRLQRSFDRDMNPYYKPQCDFYDEDRKVSKDAIAETCTAAGPKGTWLLWGDSHAQALSHGLRTILPSGISLAQIATSGCRPRLTADPQPARGNACNKSNEYARQQLKVLAPSVLILAQKEQHEATDWDEIARFAHDSGVSSVVLVGPAPHWEPSLPMIIVKRHWGSDVSAISDGLVRSVFQTDQVLSVKYQHAESLKFVSLLQHLCSDQGCLAKVPEMRNPYNLTAVDYGHLSPEGSKYVAEKILLRSLSL